MYARNCPECNIELTYKYQRSFSYAIKNNSTCKKCGSKKRITNYPKYRFCPICSRKITYKNKHAAKNAESKKTKCKECAVKYTDRSVFHTQEFKDKISKNFSGMNNPMFGKSVYDIWVKKYGKKEADKKQSELNKKRSILYSGKGNPMYGKPTPVGSGNGWGGWYKGKYFRSILELSFMVRMDEYKIGWNTAETAKYTVYSEDFTYRPDFIINETLVEIKPLRLQSTIVNEKKFIAAKKFAKENGLRFKIIDPTILDIETLTNLVKCKKVKFNKTTLPKYLKYVNKNKIHR